MRTMAKGNLEERIEQVRDLARQPRTEATLAALRKAVADRSNLVAEQAAKGIAEIRLHDLTPDLIAAFDRMLQKGASADPKCWGKTAIVGALKKMDYEESPPFVRGLKHIQMEPVWGGQEDTAAPLRGACALALIQCSDI